MSGKTNSLLQLQLIKQSLQIVQTYVRLGKNKSSHISISKKNVCFKHLEIWTKSKQILLFILLTLTYMWIDNVIFCLTTPIAQICIEWPKSVWFVLLDKINLIMCVQLVYISQCCTICCDTYSYVTMHRWFMLIYWVLGKDFYFKVLQWE